METPPSLPRAALTAGITSCAFQAGLGLATTFPAVPAILQSPTPSLQVHQWRSIYVQGIYFGPPVGIFSCLNLVYLTYHAYTTGSEKWKGFAGAAACAIAIIPFTLVALVGVNGTLMRESERKKGEEGLKEGEVRGLLERWGRVNGVRSLLPLSAALIGLWTAAG